MGSPGEKRTLRLGESEVDPYRGPLPKAALMSNTASALFPTHTSWVWGTNKARLSYRPHRSGTTANSNITPSSTQSCHFFFVGAISSILLCTYKHLFSYYISTGGERHFPMWPLGSSQRAQKEKSDGWTAWFLISRGSSNFLMIVGK